MRAIDTDVVMFHGLLSRWTSLAAAGHVKKCHVLMLFGEAVGGTSI